MRNFIVALALLSGCLNTSEFEESDVCEPATNDGTAVRCYIPGGAICYVGLTNGNGPVVNGCQCNSDGSPEGLEAERTLCAEAKGYAGQ